MSNGTSIWRFWEAILQSFLIAHSSNEAAALHVGAVVSFHLILARGGRLLQLKT